jgi:hypothetical protein
VPAAPLLAGHGTKWDFDGDGKQVIGMSLYLFVGVVAGVGLLGFSGGLFLFKVKSRWCPDCGAWTTAARPAYPNRASQMNRHIHLSPRGIREPDDR